MSAPLTLRVRRGAAAAVIAGIALGASAAPAHAFPTHTDVTDSFDRSALGPNWSTGSFGAAASTPVLGSNRIQFPSTLASAHYAASAFGTTQEAHILKRSPGFIGVTACVTNPGLTGNGFAVIANGDGTLTIAKFAGGSRSDLATGIQAGNITTWDSVGIRVAAGTVSAYARKGTNAWQLVGSANDSAAASCAGHVGVIGQSVSGDDFRGGGTAPGPADTTAPTVAMTQPSNGAAVSGTVTLAASAGDNVGVAGVQFQVDGQNVGAEVTSAPWTLSWNSAQVANGPHTVRAIARDAAGNTATSSAITVTVNNQAAPADTDVTTAQGFANSVGVNTHFTYSNELYCTKFDDARSRLNQALIRQVRESITTSEAFSTACQGATQRNAEGMLTTLGGDGIKTQLVLHTLGSGQTSASTALSRIGTGNPSDGVVDLLDRAQTLHQAQALRALEGPNEFDRVLGLETYQTCWIFCSNPWTSYAFPWRNTLRPYNEAFFDPLGAVEALDGVPVTLSAFAKGFDRQTEQYNSSRAYLRNGAGPYDPTPFLDESNAHPYFGKSMPESTAAGWMADAVALAGPNKPAIVTETGYNTHLPDNRGISPAAVATYLPRLLFTLRDAGAKSTFLYQLADTVQGGSAAENRYGLLDTDMNPKPAYHALQRLMQALQDPTGSYTSAATPQVTVSAGGAEVRTSVLKRRNGVFDVAVWRPVSVFDGATNTDIAVSPVSATVSFPSGYTARTLTPSQNLGQDVTPASWSAATGSPMGVSLAGDLMLVRLTPTS